MFTGANPASNGSRKEDPAQLAIGTGDPQGTAPLKRRGAALSARSARVRPPSHSTHLKLITKLLEVGAFQVHNAHVRLPAVYIQRGSDVVAMDLRAAELHQTPLDSGPTARKDNRPSLLLRRGAGEGGSQLLEEAGTC